MHRVPASPVPRSLDRHAAPRHREGTVSAKGRHTAARAAGLCLVAGAVLVLAGCGRSGPRPVPVSGQVRLDGKPLADGFVRVLPDTGRAAGGRIGENGRFTLTTHDEGDGCLPGTHRVEVVARNTRGGEGSTGSPHANEWLAPKKYADFTTSGLTVTIDGPTDALVIDLVSEDSPQP